MVNMHRTPEDKAIVREYLSHQKNVPVKIAVLGALHSGRHNILRRLTLGEFIDCYDPSDNGEHRMIVQVEDTFVIINLEMSLRTEDSMISDWERDLAKQGEGILLVYDVTSRHTFERLQSLYAQLLEPSEGGKPVWVCGNKMDLPQNDWQVSLEQGKAFSNTIGADFCHVSALTGEGLGKQDAARLASQVIRSWLPKTGVASLTSTQSKNSTSLFSLGRIREKVRRLFQSVRKDREI